MGPHERTRVKERAVRLGPLRSFIPPLFFQTSVPLSVASSHSELDPFRDLSRAALGPHLLYEYSRQVILVKWNFIVSPWLSVSGTDWYLCVIDLSAPQLSKYATIPNFANLLHPLSHAAAYNVGCIPGNGSNLSISNVLSTVDSPAAAGKARENGASPLYLPRNGKVERKAGGRGGLDKKGVAKKRRKERKERKEGGQGGWEIGKETNSESYSDPVYSRSSRRTA